MKKLTTGIFTVLLGLVAADANAAITSKAYVDQKVGAVEGSVTTLENTVTEFKDGINTTITNQIKEELESPDSDIAKELATKADATDLEALDGRVETAEGEIDTLQGTVGDATKGLVKGLADEVSAREAGDKAINDTIGTLPEGKTVAQAIADAASGASDATDALAKRVTTNEGAIKTINESAVMTSGITAAGVTQITTNKDSIGTLTELSTTEKGNLVGAINEVATKAGSDLSDLETTLTEKVSAEQTRAEAAEKKNADDIAAMDTAYKAADTELKTAVDAAQKDATQALNESIKKVTATGEDGTYVLTIKTVGDLATLKWENITREETTPVTPGV